MKRRRGGPARLTLGTSAVAGAAPATAPCGCAAAAARAPVKRDDMAARLVAGGCGELCSRQGWTPSSCNLRGGLPADQLRAGKFAEYPPHKRSNERTTVAVARLTNSNDNL
eukprot:scaffold65552_cov43-Phaeocystis_antarctica.AAC.2